MLRGISRWSLPGDWELARCAAVCAEAGIEAVELGFDDTGPVGVEGTPQSARAAAETLDRHGLKLAGIIGGGPMWTYGAISARPEVRARSRELTRQLLDQAQAMGLSFASIVPGAVQNIFGGDGELVPYAQAWDNLVAFGREMAGEAEQRGVRLLIENVWNKFMYSPLELVRMMEAIGADWVGLHFDVGNTLLYGVPQDYIRILGRHIGAIHVKDWKANPGGLAGFCPLLEGEVDWPAVMAALREIGWDGALVAEIMPVYRHYPEVMIHHTALSLRAIIEGGLK